MKRLSLLLYGRCISMTDMICETNRHDWRRGYARESCEALIRKVYGESDHRNTASWKMLESLGFTREAHLKRNVFFWKDEADNPIRKDTFVYAKTDL